MRIRQEKPEDYDEVYALVRASFVTSTNEGEWDYLNEMRKKAAFRPELSLVGQIVQTLKLNALVWHLAPLIGELPKAEGDPRRGVS